MYSSSRAHDKKIDIENCSGLVQKESVYILLSLVNKRSINKLESFFGSN